MICSVSLSRGSKLYFEFPHKSSSQWQLNLSQALHVHLQPKWRVLALPCVVVASQHTQPIVKLEAHV